MGIFFDSWLGEWNPSLGGLSFYWPILKQY
jgi:hypothetical protein